MSVEPISEVQPEQIISRQSMDVDIACVGFGPATGGFLTTLTQAWTQNPADPAFESKAAPGMPLQVLCYERADDLASGVSGVVTQARGISASFPALNPAEIPMAANVTSERMIYLLDPLGASRRSLTLRIADKLLRLFVKDHAFTLPWTPAFLHKHGGLVLSIGQFNQWVASHIMASGLVQIWPGTPVAAPLFNGKAVKGIRLADQGVDKSGAPSDNFLPGMDIHAQLTVVGDGPVGPIGRALDQNQNGTNHRDWALGMKFVIELPPESTSPDSSPEDSSIDALKPGTVWHTFGYPEPEIFGFLYVHPNRLISVGIFIPSWLSDPSRTAYRYLQHFIQHPALWKVLKDGTLRSWGAKSLEESGRRCEPVLTGDGYARIGEGSGSTNLLTNSGVDEAWTTGAQLAEAVLALLRANLPFTQENLSKTYEKKRRASWVETGARQAENARNGFHGGIVKGLFGVALTGLTRGRLSLKAQKPPTTPHNTPGAPSIARSLRNGWESQPGAPSMNRSLIHGWDTTNSTSPGAPSLSRSQPGAPSMNRSLIHGWDTTNSTSPGAPSLSRSQPGAPSMNRSLIHGWDTTNSTSPGAPSLSRSQPGAPSVNRSLIHGWDTTNSTSPGAPSLSRSQRKASESNLERAAALAHAEGRTLHDALLSVRGWPEIPYDGRLLVTQQDALLLGGKVQAMPGFADHVTFRDPALCTACAEKTCVSMCSGQAITQAEDGQPTFEREKCIHCGACLWNCANTPAGATSNIDFRAGSGGLHSAEN